MDKKRYSKIVPLCYLPELEKKLKKKKQFRHNKIVPVSYLSKCKNNSKQIEECEDNMGNFQISNKVMMRSIEKKNTSKKNKIKFLFNVFKTIIDIKYKKKLEDLPNEIIVEIFLYTKTFQEFLKFQNVNKRFKEITEEMIFRMKDRVGVEDFYSFFNRMLCFYAKKKFFIDYFIITYSKIIFSLEGKDNLKEKQKEYNSIIASFKYKDISLLNNNNVVITKLYYSLLNKDFLKNIFFGKSLSDITKIKSNPLEKTVFGDNFISRLNSVKGIAVRNLKQEDCKFLKYLPVFFRELTTICVTDFRNKDDKGFDLFLKSIPKTIQGLRVIQKARIDRLNEKFDGKKERKLCSFKLKNPKIKIYLDSKEITTINALDKICCIL